MSMLEMQIRVLTTWIEAGDTMRRRMELDRDRGEVTAQTAMIVILVIAAIAAGTIIAARIAANANNVPEP